MTALSETKRYQAYPEYKYSGIEWMGDIPNEWVTIPVGRLYSRTKRTGHSEKELLSVYRDYGVIPKSSRDDNNNKESDDLTPYQLVQPNDLVMNKMKAWQGSIAVSEYEGIVSPAYFVYEPREKLFELAHPRYVHYLLRNPIYITQYMSRSKGIRVNQWDLDPDEFKTIELLLPSKDEQNKIFEFLDHETAKIDTLIEKQQQLIKLLKEKRQAVISHAVTKGLNPQTPMKDSGVEWLGEVPEHWEIPKIGLACDVTKLTGFEYTNHWAVSDDGEIIALRGFNIKERFLDLLKVERISSKLSKKLSRSKLNLGDIVLPCTGTLGNACVIEADDTFHINQNIAKLSFDSRVDPHFASYWLTSEPFRRMVDFNNTSGMQPVLLIGDIRNMPLPMPPKSEQKQIVESLKNQVGTIERTIFNGESAVNLLKERRTALISAAVTGKIDVRNWQAPTSQNQELEQTA
ncbi:restriction endonuclease subunit S [Vibrio parahaemolyticus]|uniref:restriction endonuclease subunit S n=1 Tax=Vibrio parahaemolyticus TaxID=670 RepID=UPI00235EEF10|nr:restriction endonuclease subunit S [Vibrio parahaemolyticus]